jgi:hypothetical protein
MLAVFPAGTGQTGGPTCAKQIPPANATTLTPRSSPRNVTQRESILKKSIPHSIAEDQPKPTN